MTTKHNFEWAVQEVFDMMANQKIEITIMGELHEVDATLKIESMTLPPTMVQVADVIGADDMTDALIELLEKAGR